jgi:hypothetical protein
MIQTTTWHPDTCECVIEYTWDDQQKEDVRKHTFSKVTHCGGDHPVPAVGTQVEDSDFHKDHVSKQKKIVLDGTEQFTSEERKQLRKLLGG